MYKDTAQPTTCLLSKGDNVQTLDGKFKQDSNQCKAKRS